MLKNLIKLTLFIRECIIEFLLWIRFYFYFDISYFLIFKLKFQNSKLLLSWIKVSNLLTISFSC